MMEYLGKHITSGTGMGVDPKMYTIAKLDEHLGCQMWFVYRQTTCPEQALRGYMDLRNIWGSEATIHVIKPGAITAA
jgi:hypothetical protein